MTTLSDGSSTSHGADKTEPTSFMLSNYKSKNYGHRDRAVRMLNFKFTPKSLEGEEGTEKMVSFIRTMVDFKLWHVQFNVINKSTLVAAHIFSDIVQALQASSTQKEIKKKDSLFLYSERVCAAK